MPCFPAPYTWLLSHMMDPKTRSLGMPVCVCFPWWLVRMRVIAGIWTCSSLSPSWALVRPRRRERSLPRVQHWRTAPSSGEFGWKAVRGYLSGGGRHDSVPLPGNRRSKRRKLGEWSVCTSSVHSHHGPISSHHAASTAAALLFHDLYVTRRLSRRHVTRRTP